MSELEDIVKRKIRNRKLAIENLGLEDKETNNIVSGTISSLDIQELDKIYTIMFNHIQAINDNWYLNPYRPICSNRRYIGSIIVFMKKVIRKFIKIFLGWYIFPVIETQNVFNSNAVNSINLMKDVIVHLNEKESYNADILKKQEESLRNLLDCLKCEKEKVNDYENKFKEQVENLKDTIHILNDKIEKLQGQEEKLLVNNEYFLDRLNVTCDIELLKNAPKLDYFKFENIYRGSRENIKESQRHYVDYFRNNGGLDILDIGCGRGEFLELMYEYGLSARGLDSYEPFVKYCKERGLSVELGDALTYLDGLEDLSLGGIFMGHVVEHLPNDYILAVIKTAYKKLVPGTYFIIESPNPETLSTFKNFNLDMGHIKPIHFLTLEYCFKEANYENVERFNNEFSKYPEEVNHIAGKAIDNLEEFNRGMDAINELIFGYRDYALIAKK